MPALCTWKLHHPSRWTQEQGEAYCSDTTAALVAGMTPATIAVGPVAACNILLASIFHIMRANPVFVDDVLENVAKTAEALATIMPNEGAVH